MIYKGSKYSKNPGKANHLAETKYILMHFNFYLFGKKYTPFPRLLTILSAEDGLL